MFIRNLDGTQGRLKRQCTKEYKIEPIELWIRRELLGLAPKKHIPKGVTIRQWFGISDDEAGRATFPGLYKNALAVIGTDIFGEPVYRKGRVWRPQPWRQNVYPLLNEIWLPNRTILSEGFLSRREQRADCGDWLARNYPGRTFPRSACIGCPFRSNREWKEMRDERPEEWADAVEFDTLQRQADLGRQVGRGILVGTPFLHRQMIPLDMADLDGDGEKGGGCGTLLDGMDGLCDV